MARWQVAYWGEAGVDIYQMAGHEPARLLYSGPPEGLKSLKGGMQRRVLIVGRSHATRLRKRYPPMKMEQLFRAVETEMATLFPIVDGSFHCRVFETYATHVIVDIWAWERGPLERVRDAFAFRYALPEDLAFLASPAGIHIYLSGSMVQVIACGDGRFLDAASYPAADFAKADLERFLMGLGDGLAAIKEIRLYGKTPADVPSSVMAPVKRIPNAACPPFLETAAGISYTSFRVKTGRSPRLFDRTVLLRFVLYALLAYGLMLFLTLRNFDKALGDLKTNALAVETETRLLDREGLSQEDPEAIKAFEASMKENIPPLRILDVLAAELPEDCRVTRLVLNNGIVEVLISTRDPLPLIRRLGSSERIEKAGLKGAPVKEASTGIYNCAFTLDIKP